MKQEYAFSERRACSLVMLAASTYRYQSRRSDEPLRARLVELARAKPCFGYRRLHVLLGRSGERMNHKKLHRIYREAGLTIRRKKRKHCVRTGNRCGRGQGPTMEWALDFVHDAVACGRTIRVLSVVDAYTRECLSLEVDTSFASRRVTRGLKAIVAERGQPQAIRCDNGPGALPARKGVETRTMPRSNKMLGSISMQSSVRSSSAHLRKTSASVDDGSYPGESRCSWAVGK